MTATPAETQPRRDVDSADADPPPSEPPAVRDRLLSGSTRGQVAAALRTPQVLLACGLSLLAFYWIGGLVGFPHAGPFDAAVLHQPLGVGLLLLFGLLLIPVAAAGTLVCGRVRYDAGWGAAVLGLLALRWRGGDGYHALDGRSPGVFVGFAIELIVLTLFAAAAWAGLHWLRERGATAPRVKRWLELPEPAVRIADRKAAGEALDQKLLALLASTAVTALAVGLLARSTDETQVFFAVFIGGWLGATVAHGFVPARPGPWFWGGPVLAGLIGYGWTAFTIDPAALATGETGGLLAPLARPLPLDWLGAGVPAALLAYVRSRSKQTRRVAESRANTPSVAA